MYPKKVGYGCRVNNRYPTPIPETPDFFFSRLRVTPESFFSILLILQAKITIKFMTCCYLIDSTNFLVKNCIFYKKNVIYLRHKMNHMVFYFGLFFCKISTFRYQIRSQHKILNKIGIKNSKKNFWKFLEIFFQGGTLTKFIKQNLSGSPLKKNFQNFSKIFFCYFFQNFMLITNLCHPKSRVKPGEVLDSG